MGKWFRWAWLIWGLILLVGFAVVEWIAVAGKRHERDTLTSNIQYWLKKDRPTWVAHVSIGVWAAFSVWFAVHLFA